MAFFDRVGKKATEVTSKTIEKAQKFSETSKLNSLISDEEKKIRNNYYQIGQLYVSIHSSDSEEEFKEMVDSILDSRQKIEKYKRQIQDINGVCRCEKCGGEVPKDSAFCSNCGAPMPKVETIPEGYVKCSSCGAYSKSGMKFCTSCGKPLLKTADKPLNEAADVKTVSNEALESEEAEMPMAESKVEDKVCPSCGAKVEANTAFCVECGAKLQP